MKSESMSMAKKTGLGRGLEALIPGGERPSMGGVITLRVDQIDRNPRQPRTRIDSQELSELADSIREHGILQPLIVSEAQQPGQYLLIAGERRLLAARQAGLERVPVLIREASDQERLELALIENVQRADLSPLEAAEAYRQLADDFGLSHEEIARRVSKSRVAVTNTLRLLNLPEKVLQALMDGLITEGHARALLALATSQGQVAALQTVLAQELNVRQTEALVRRLSGERPPAMVKPAPPAEIGALQNKLESWLGTPVSLKNHRKGGTITIRYYSEEELNALVERMLGPTWDN
jgi:ParB family transcriptional regulator, chromosome partitioning protein